MYDEFEWIGSRTRYFIVKFLTLFRHWRSLIIAGVRNIGWEGSNTALHTTDHRHAVHGQ